MKKYKDKKSGMRLVEVDDLSFISDRNHRYGWFRLHYKHHRLRFALKRADKVLVADHQVARDVVKYYFVPKSKIIIGRAMSRPAARSLRRILSLRRLF